MVQNEMYNLQNGVPQFKKQKKTKRVYNSKS